MKLLGTSLVTRPGQRRASAGFTIVEVAVAAFVLVFSLTSTIVALQTGYKSLDVSRGVTLASQIAQSEIERIRLLNWSGTGGISELPAEATVDVGSIFTQDPAVASRFTVIRQVSAVPGDTRTNADQLKQITITVTWKTIDGMTHSRVFKTLYSKNGLYDYFHTIAR
jgi:hypothetical protein